MPVDDRTRSVSHLRPDGNDASARVRFIGGAVAYARALG